MLSRRLIKQYYYITGKKLDPLSQEPKLSDYYVPSPDQQNRELLFIVAVKGFVAYSFCRAKKNYIIKKLHSGFICMTLVFA